MKLTLSNNVVVHLGARHLDTPNGKRKTQVWFLFPDGRQIVAEAKCYIKDNFCKRTGRKIAAQYLLQKLFNLSKDDRRLVFFKLCPEYNNKNK